VYKGKILKARKRKLKRRDAAQSDSGRLSGRPVAVAAEFTGHSVPTLQGPLSTEDYVAIETALLGASAARIKLSSGDFSPHIGTLLSKLAG
jgi:hypothetical protein